MNRIIYKIAHTLPDGTEKLYVGLTVQTLKERFDAHMHQVSRARNRATGSLGEAIRIAYQKGLKSAEFKISELQACGSEVEAKSAEAEWITRLDTKTPHGYNIMPGGSSLGGPSNSIPLELLVEGVRKTYSSIAEACREFAVVRGEPFERLYPRVRARISAYGWSPEEAFELDPRQDGRSTDLAVQARAAGENIATRRSRVYREKLRKEATIAGKCRLPHPVDPTAGPVSARRFAEMTGIAASTVRYRAKQIAAVKHELSPHAIIAHVLGPQDRSHRLTVMLGDGTRVSGSKNELAKLFEKRTYPEGRFRASTIRVRLRKIASAPSNGDILWALGLMGGTEPYRRLVKEGPVVCTEKRA